MSKRENEITFLFIRLVISDRKPVLSRGVNHAGQPGYTLPGVHFPFFRRTHPAASIKYYPDLPAKVPQHYGAGGQVDAWGGKSLVFMLPVISLVLYGLMTGLRWLSPSAGGKKVSPRQWRLTVDMINWLKVITVWTFTYLNWMTLQIGLGYAQALHPAFNPIMLGSMTVIMVFSIWKIMKAAE